KMIRSWWKRRNPQPDRTQSLLGEELEPRCVPARYRWNQDTLTSNDNWDNYKNWDKWNETTRRWIVCGAVIGTPYPGENGVTDDDVEFSGKTNNDCIVNVPNLTLHSLSIRF